MPVWLALVFLLAYVSLVFIVGVMWSLLNQRICLRVNCLARAALLTKSVDHETEPCDNFYRYVCGNPNISIWDRIERKQQYRLSRFLSRPMVDDDYSVLRMAKMLYGNCVDPSKRVDKEGVQPYLYVRSLNGERRFLKKTKRRGIQVSTEEKLARQSGLGTAHFYEVRIVPSQFLPRHVAQFSTPKALRRKFYASHNNQVIFATEVYKVLSGNENLTDDVRVAINDTVNFKEKLLNATRSERLGLPDSYKLVRLEDLLWSLSIRINLDFDRIDLRTSDKVLISSNFVHYIGELDRVVRKMENRVLKFYIVLEQVIAHIEFFPKSLRQIYDKYMKSSDELFFEREDGKQLLCANILRNILATTLTSFYIGKYFPNGYIDSHVYIRINEFIWNTKMVLQPMINRADWISVKDKGDINSKIKYFTVQAPLPDDIMEFLSNKTEVENHLSGFCFRNITVLDEIFNLNADLYELNMKLSNLTKKHWNVFQDYYDVFSANLYYDNQRRALIIPMVLFEYPSFDLNWPRYLNYGGFGSLLVQELIRGLDFGGINYGESEPKKHSWSNFTKTNYDKKRTCFLDQYNKYVEPLTGVNVTDLTEIHDNIQDSAAIVVSHRAYHNYAKARFYHEAKLKGWEKYSVDQLFFINYATYYCKKLDKIYTRGMEKYEVAGASQEYRIVGSLRNYPGFSKAFRCMEGDGMNPVDKCHIF
uniref:Peptidase M13 C-terminal domain-containing protein n=1 Tax=Graphocephala atropunctata TaxID=36148 RepID=A0A1B6MHC4_9HEMI